MAVINPGFPGGREVIYLPMQEKRVRSLGQEDALEEGMANLEKPLMAYGS